MISGESLPFRVVDAARALPSRPDVGAQISDRCPVGATGARLGTADGVALSGVVVERGNASVRRALKRRSCCIRDGRQGDEQERMSAHVDF